MFVLNFLLLLSGFILIIYETNRSCNSYRDWYYIEYKVTGLPPLIESIVFILILCQIFLCFICSLFNPNILYWAFIPQILYYFWKEYQYRKIKKIYTSKYIRYSNTDNTESKDQTMLNGLIEEINNLNRFYNH